MAVIEIEQLRKSYRRLRGGTTLALVQGLLFLLLAPFVGISFSIASVIWLVMVMFLLAFALTGLGFLLAWRMDSTQGFHAIMNLFLIPMWFLSGALFPLEGVTFAPLRWAQGVPPFAVRCGAI